MRGSRSTISTIQGRTTKTDVALPSDDYNGMPLEEWKEEIAKDVQDRFGDVIQNATWEPMGEAGW